MLLPLMTKEQQNKSDLKVDAMLDQLAAFGAPKEMYIMIMEKLEEVHSDMNEKIIGKLINMLAQGN